MTDSPTRYSETILVTGDIVKDITVYQGDRLKPSLAGSVNPHCRVTLGGAHQLYEVIRAAAGEDRAQFAFAPLTVEETMDFPDELAVQTLWRLQEGGLKREYAEKGEKEKPSPVWRVAEPLGYALAPEGRPCRPPLKPVKREGQEPPVVLVIDDAGLGFRSLRTRFQGLWPEGISRTEERQPKWIVHKMSYPVTQGDLWRELVYSPNKSGPQRRDNLIVVLSGDELRFAGAAISRGYSWERTLSELHRELTRNIAFMPLLQYPRYLIVNFGCVGAVLYECQDGRNDKEIQFPSRLVYDPSLAEGQWKHLMRDPWHSVYGVMNTFTAAIALHLLALHQEDEKAPDDTREPFSDLTDGICRGLTGIRLLRLHGHESEKEINPGFPYTQVAEGIQPPGWNRKKGEDSGEEQNRPWKEEAPGKNKRVAEYGYEIIEMPVDRTLDSDEWTLVSLSETPSSPTQPLCGLAHCYALYGEQAIRHIPHARFGELLSVDRLEIETLRSLRHMIDAYAKDEKARKPLCLAAFGPPGAGKSFGIIQIANEILGKNGKRAEVLTFNLSQYQDPDALIGAYHQVRDKVLQGHLPVVFWDEFDSQDYKWLQYLLSPMQDGAFQEDQLIHPLGKCVFVFAGATSWDFESFGPLPQPPKDGKKREEWQKSISNNRNAEELQANFRLKKGPDFLSRLDGHINVLGPNPRMLYDYAKHDWTRKDPADITWPVRRAILLRSFLGARTNDTLDIDRDLLRAFLLGPNYVFGARSLEKIARPLAGSPKPFRRAYLPPPQVLEQHLASAGYFDEVYAGNRLFREPEKLWLIASAIMEHYWQLYYQAKGEPRIPRTQDEFIQALADEDAWGRATNLAAAARVPEVLALAGLQIESGDYQDKAEHDRIQDHILHPHYLYLMAREEHNLWMQFHRENNWGYVDPKTLDSLAPADREKEIRRLKKEECLHTLLQPFDILPEEEKEKDYNTVKRYQDMLKLIGHKIVFM